MEIYLPKEYYTERYFRYKQSETELTGHMYYHSPIETYDSCGNCNGAKCDMCRKVILAPTFEFSIPADEFEKMLISQDVNEYYASKITYDDFYHPKKDEPRFIYPHPTSEMIVKWMTPDEKVINYIKTIDFNKEVNWDYDYALEICHAVYGKDKESEEYFHCINQLRIYHDK